ncbi:MAG: peptidase M61, partial [Moorea sp. SIO3I7]|nr:peptidase M61 [Moorena sp. SIO3I7]
MTEARTIFRSSAATSTLAIHYHVAMPQPQSHLFEVTLQVEGWEAPLLDLKMPVWTPGSYLVREYARHLQDFSADTGNPSQSLPWRKLAKNHWLV